MNSLLEMNKIVSQKLGDKLTQVCSPLVTHLGVNHFYHFVYTHSGQFVVLGLNQAWQECLHASDDMRDSHYNFYHTREQLKGVLFTQTIPQQQWKKLAKNASEKFKINIGLQISHQTAIGVEGFGFGLKSKDPLDHMALLQELPLLNLFIHRYKQDINTDILIDNLVDLPEIIGPSFLKKPAHIKNDLRTIILGKMKVNVSNPFSKRETEVVQLLLMGSPTASEIADQLFLSKRTVDDHLARIKEKLDCCTKSQMMQKLKELESFGLLF